VFDCGCLPELRQRRAAIGGRQFNGARKSNRSIVIYRETPAIRKRRVDEEYAGAKSPCRNVPTGAISESYAKLAKILFFLGEIRCKMNS
jgi:hypothetical protein